MKTIQKYNKESMAKAIGRALPISTKHSIEICNLIRKKTTKKAKDLLNKIIKKEIAVPFKKFKKDMPHRKGKIAAGRYPKKASMYILKLINNVEANAQNLNLDTENLVINSIYANKASTSWRYGRKRRRQRRSTNIEIIVEEKHEEKKKEQKPVKKQEKKAEK